MFDREGFATYVGAKSGATYVARLGNIESLYEKNIDAEYDKDKCSSLLLYLQGLRESEGISKAERNELSARTSNLRKYIEFKNGGRPTTVIQITQQFRECFRDVAVGTRMKRQEIIDLLCERFGTNPSSVIPSDYCYNMKNKGIPENHVSFFLNVGTGLYEYVGEDYKTPTIEGIIEAYKADFERIDDEERYKWEAIAHYKKHWDIEAENFAEMLREAFRKAGEGYKRARDGKIDGGNLLTSSMYYPYKMVYFLAQQEPETVRNLFKILYDEETLLSLRYTEFRDGFEKCLERYRSANPDNKKLNNHFQDLRAISVYLTFEYPEKYYLYKYRMYKSFADLLGVRESVEQGKDGKLSSFEGYNELCEKVLTAVKADHELQEISKARLDDECYQDPVFHILTMDIIYFGSQLAKEEAYKMKGTKGSAKTGSTDIGLNTILYGPPGTGKTYNTVIYAVAIIENKLLEEVQAEPYDTVMERYNAYKADGLIEFTTFHQSYGYEEFIEGIKPNMDTDDNEQSDIEYEIASGVFKSFCERAGQPIAKQAREDFGLNKAPTVWKVSLDGTGDNPVRSECLANGHIRIGWDGYGEILTDETEYADGGKVVLNAFMNKMKVGELVLSCYSATTIDAVGVVTGDYEWNNAYDRMKRVRKVNWLVKDIREDIVERNGANMTLASVYRLNISVADVMAIVLKNSPETGKVQAGSNNYVFIIDEINRGNISKIFGELITLIESSKRIGQAEATTAKLPYSQRPFGVPDNVFLLGTMNTADRSIAAIDTALRRRFQFVEMQPDPEVLEGVSVEDISIRELLERMNKKISVLYDREQTIGHGYFMPLKAEPTIENLASIFENNIIPLLQ